jgi:hypothetical protein
MQDYKFLKIRGSLSEAAPTAPLQRGTSAMLELLGTTTISSDLIALVPESVARENVVIPLSFDGETITFAAVDPDNIALADKLRFILAKNVRLVPARRDSIVAAIERHYGAAETESVESLLCELTDSTADFDESLSSAGRARHAMPRTMGPPVAAPKKLLLGLDNQQDRRARAPGSDPTAPIGGEGVMFYTVEEGQRVLMSRLNGTVEIIVGPRRVWRGWSTFRKMDHYVAHPDEFLIIRYRDGRQEHLPGPAEVWFDPREHLQITKENALQIAAKEAVVVYSRSEASNVISRRVVNGPALFVPRPGEWLHTFSWHASKGGSQGAQKVAHALVFQKLWLMPDQMYHDVNDVRTADDAVITVRLMIFFELIDVDRMLDATHDPIGDFVNAATSDVVGFTGRHDFEQFKRNTAQLNELETYHQLTSRAAQCGYRINKVVYRGYGAAPALQQMHDQAIEARTRLQLDRATEQQAQDLENYKLDCQLARAGKRRTEQVQEVEHDLALARTRQEAELRQREAAQAAHRESHRLEAELHLAIRTSQDDAQRRHLDALRALGVDLTAFLTQARADQVIEFRGESRPHVHLDRLAKADGKGAGGAAAR